MLPGFNHNIRHQGVLFHVQTEDKGLDNPVVVTQLFVDGNVLATRRGSYDKFMHKSEVHEIVLAMMQELHKGMMKDLIHGRIKAAVDYIAHSASQAPAAAVKKAPTFEAQPDVHDKTLDELILEFLSSHKQSKP